MKGGGVGKREITFGEEGWHIQRPSGKRTNTYSEEPNEGHGG